MTLAAVRANAPAFGLAALMALAAKAAYARLPPEQLGWMAWPTQGLVSLLTGIDFSHEAGYGYVNLAHRLVIAKSCLGVNYLIAVFGMLAFTAIPAAAGQWRKVLLLAPLAAAAWAATVLTNGVRIALGIALHEARLSWGWLTPERVHRGAGIAVYFLALVAIGALARRVTEGSSAGRPGATGVLATALLWYGLVAVGLPLANGALLDRPRLFLEHGASVLLITPVLGGALLALARGLGAQAEGRLVLSQRDDRHGLLE